MSVLTGSCGRTHAEPRVAQAHHAVAWRHSSRPSTSHTRAARRVSGPCRRDCRPRQPAGTPGGAGEGRSRNCGAHLHRLSPPQRSTPLPPEASTLQAIPYRTDPAASSGACGMYRPRVPGGLHCGREVFSRICGYALVLVHAAAPGADPSRLTPGSSSAPGTAPPAGAEPQTAGARPSPNGTKRPAPPSTGPRTLGPTSTVLTTAAVWPPRLCRRAAAVCAPPVRKREVPAVRPATPPGCQPRHSLQHEPPEQECRSLETKGLHACRNAATT